MATTAAASSWQVDTTTLVLGFTILALVVLSMYFRSPPPQAHPFLLGRQITASRTRYPNESPVYTNSATGGIRPALRPTKIKTLADIINPSLTKLEGGASSTWIKGGETLKAVVFDLRAGLLSVLGSEPGSAAVLIDDPTDALLVTLALALTAHKPYVISPGSNIPPSAGPFGPFTTIVHSPDRISDVQKLSVDETTRRVVIGAGNTAAEDLVPTGRALVEDGKVPPVADAEPTEVALTIVSEGVPLEFTHVNLTASLISWLSMFPAAPHPTRPDIKDHLVSFHHPSTPYGLGLALFAIHTNAAISLPSVPSLATPESMAAVFAPSPPATLVFAPNNLVQSLYRHVLTFMLTESAFMIQMARDGKLRLLREGTVSKSTFWDSLLFGQVASKSRLHQLRALVFAGPALQTRVEFFRTTLGAPTMTVQPHAFLLAPLSAPLLFDVQRLPHIACGPDEISGQEVSHVGPPVSGVELKFRGLEADFAGGRLRGEILIRTPLLPQPATLPPSLLVTDNTLPSLPPYPAPPRPTHAQGGDSERWLRTGLTAELAPEGVLWVGGPSACA